MLAGLGFKEAGSSTGGMSQYYLWSGNDMKFSLHDDRGYYECNIISINKPIERLELIKLLRFLKDDAFFYREELKIAKLSGTLSANAYVDLFYKNYRLIKDFLFGFSQSGFDD